MDPNEAELVKYGIMGASAIGVTAALAIGVYHSIKASIKARCESDPQRAKAYTEKVKADIELEKAKTEAYERRIAVRKNAFQEMIADPNYQNLLTQRQRVSENLINEGTFDKEYSEIDDLEKMIDAITGPIPKVEDIL